MGLDAILRHYRSQQPILTTALHRRRQLRPQVCHHDNVLELTGLDGEFEFVLKLSSDVEAQSLQLSTEQLATSSAAGSSYLNTSVTDAASTSSAENGHLVSSSSSPSSVASAAVTAVASAPVSRTGKTRPARKAKPRVSPYPASPTVTAAAAAAVASSSAGSIVAEAVQLNPLPPPLQEEYSNPMMDYRYDAGLPSTSVASSGNQYLTSTMYSAYNSNEVQLYNYGPNGVAEAANGSGSNHSGGDLYNPYYETDNMAAYPGPATLRHYTNLGEGKSMTPFSTCRPITVSNANEFKKIIIKKVMKWKLPEVICTVAARIHQRVIRG
jgi:hypothetical protein